MVTSGQQWSALVSSGQQWLLVVTSGQQWSLVVKIDLDGQEWTPVSTTCRRHLTRTNLGGN